MSHDAAVDPLSDDPVPETATPAAAFGASENPRVVLPCPQYMNRAARTFALAELLATCSTWPVSRLDALIVRMRASRRPPTPAHAVAATGPFQPEDEHAARLARLMHLAGTLSASQLAGWLNAVRAAHWAPGRNRRIFSLDDAPEKATATRPWESPAG